MATAILTLQLLVLVLFTLMWGSVLVLFTLMWGSVFVSSIQPPPAGRAQILWALALFLVGLISTAFQIGLLGGWIAR